MAKKPSVADSTQESATTKEFPREVVIVNDTAMNYVVARTFVGAGTSAKVVVNDDDEITRMNTDCEQIMSLNDSYKDAEVSPLRVDEIAAVAATE